MTSGNVWALVQALCGWEGSRTSNIRSIHTMMINFHLCALTMAI